MIFFPPGRTTEDRRGERKEKGERHSIQSVAAEEKRAGRGNEESSESKGNRRHEQQSK